VTDARIKVRLHAGCDMTGGVPRKIVEGRYKEAGRINFLSKIGDLSTQQKRCQRPLSETKNEQRLRRMREVKRHNTRVSRVDASFSLIPLGQSRRPSMR
jgi:hypothetical protein